MIIHQIYSTPEGDCSKSREDEANWQEEIFDPGRNRPMVRRTPQTLSRAIPALGINRRKENVTQQGVAFTVPLNRVIILWNVIGIECFV